MWKSNTVVLAYFNSTCILYDHVITEMMSAWWYHTHTHTHTQICGGGVTGAEGAGGQDAEPVCGSTALLHV